MESGRSNLFIPKSVEGLVVVIALLITTLSLLFFKDVFSVVAVILIPLIIMGFIYFFYFALRKRHVLFIPAIIGIYLGGFGNISEGAAIPYSLFQIGFIIGVAMLVLNLLYTRDLSYYSTGFELELLVYVGLILFSVMYSPNYDDSLFYAFRTILQLIFMLLLFNCVYEIKHIQAIIYLIIVIAIFMAIVGIIEYYNNPLAAIKHFLGAGAKERSVGFEKDPNVFATYFFIPLSYTLTYYFETKNIRDKIISIFFTLLFLVVISFTFSRTAYLIVFIITVYLIIKQKDYVTPLLIISAVFLLLVFDEGTRIQVQNILSRFMKLFDGAADDSSRVRLLLAGSSIQMLFDSWFLGVGFRGFPKYFVKYHSLYETIGVNEPHNLFYTVLAELGIVGFIVFMIIIISIIVRARQNMKLASTFTELVISKSLFISYIGMMIFHNSIGGGFTDNRLWLHSSLILIVHRFLTKKMRANI